jgi:hypothetical protein
MRSSTAGVDPTVSATGWAADHRGDRARDGVPASCRSSGDAAAHVGKLHDDDVCHNVLGLYAVESEAGADSSPSPWARLPTGLRNGLARAEPRLRPPRPLRASSERNADDEPGLVRSWPNPGRARESVGAAQSEPFGGRRTGRSVGRAFSPRTHAPRGERLAQHGLGELAGARHVRLVRSIELRTFAAPRSGVARRDSIQPTTRGARVSRSDSESAACKTSASGQPRSSCTRMSRSRLRVQRPRRL